MKEPTSAPKGSKTIAQGKARSAAALGCVPHTIPSPEGVKEAGDSGLNPVEFDGIGTQVGPRTP
jgi:hypothetical protein